MCVCLCVGWGGGVPQINICKNTRCESLLQTAQNSQPAGSAAEITEVEVFVGK